MAPQFPRRWKAFPEPRQLLNWWCTRCERWIPAGNSHLCGNGDHENGKPVFPDWDVDLPVENIGDVLRSCGYPNWAKLMEGAYEPKAGGS